MIEFMKKYFWFNSRNMHPSGKNNNYTVSALPVSLILYVFNSLEKASQHYHSTLSLKGINGCIGVSILIQGGSIFPDTGPVIHVCVLNF